MLTQEEHVEIHALRKRGWSYSAIARHAGLSRNTVKAYVRDGAGRESADGRSRTASSATRSTWPSDCVTTHTCGPARCTTR